MLFTRSNTEKVRHAIPKKGEEDAPLRGRHIVVLSLFRFDNLLTSTGLTLAQHLSKDNTVYYFDNPYTCTDFVKQRKTRAGALRRRYSFGQTDGIESLEGFPNLKIIFSPLLLPIHFLPEGRLYRFLLRRNESIIRNRIKQVMRQFGVDDFIFFNSYQFHYPNVVKGLQPALTVYHSLDPIHTPFDRRHGLLSETGLVQNSDLVICSSRQLYREKKGVNPNTFFIPNAADNADSRKALDPALAPSSLLDGIPGPVVGYFGSLEHRCDFALLREVVAANPGKSFVFVGPMEKEHVPDWFLSAGNVYCTGPVQHTEMPAVLKGFDVAIIPFAKNEASPNIFPLKLFEYLGAGKPVVATDFNPDLEPFTKGTVAYCADAASFSAALQAALEENGPPAVEKRLAVANENTWDIRVGEIKTLLAGYLDKTGENGKAASR